jgi:hypothetical protein
MRRKLNENVSDKLYLDVTVMAQNDPDLDFNNLRDTLVANGAIVNGKETDDNHVIMVVEEMPREQVEEVLDSLLTYGYDSTIDDDYFTELNEDEDDALNSERDYPDYDDVNINEDVDSIDESDCSSDDYECMAADELDFALKSIQGIKGDLMFEPAVVLDTVIDDVNVEVFSINSDGLADTNVGMLDVLTEVKDVNDLYTLADVIKDLVEAYEDDDVEEDMPKFERMKAKRRLEEKRTPCCPTKKAINEKLKAHDAKQQEKLDKIEANIKLVLDDINRSTIGAHEAREAFKKLKEENTKLRRINKDEKNKFSIVDVPGVKKSLKHLANVDSETAKNIEALEKSLVEKVTKALKENRSCLYENVKVNGKSLKEYSLDELYKLFNKLATIKENLTKKLRSSLNESDLTALKNELKQKNLLMEYIDNEITYRETRNQFVVNEDGEISDEELKNLFGPSQGEAEETEDEGDNESKEDDKEDNDDTSDKDNSNDEEEDEVHELSRIEITLTTMEAAVDLKDACIAAGIPEGAIEIDDNEEATEEDETSNDEESEESDSEEENSEETEETSEEQNEAYNYRNITNLLFEAEETEETSEETEETSEENDENSEESEESGNEEETSEETEENKGVKFILVNTDYTLTLVKILEDQYDISKEELEDMIGAELIDESADEESDSEENKEDKDSKKDKKDGKSKEDKEDDDLDIDPSDLFKGL